MGKRRQTYDIWADILRVTADEPRIKNDIMGEAKVMNWQRTGEYLEEMENRGLVEERDEKWVSTEEGRKFLEKYDELAEMAGMKKE